MTKFPIDAPKNKVLKALCHLGFSLAREGNHISMIRQNPDGTNAPPSYCRYQLRAPKALIAY